MENWQEHIREQFNNVRISPSRRVWANTQFELGKKEKPILKFSTASKYVVSLIAVLAISVAVLHRDPFTIQHNITIQPASPLDVMMPERTNMIPVLLNNSAKNISSTSVRSNDEISNLINRPIEVANAATGSSSELPLTIDQEDHLSPITTLNYHVASKSIANDVIGNYKNSYKKLSFAANGFYIGMTTIGQLDWLIDKDKINNPQFAYLITPGYSYGFRIGYIHNWISIETGYNFQSVEGQNYQSVNSQGNISLALLNPSTSVRLDYLQLPFIVKLKSWGMSGFTNHPFAFDIYSGVQLNSLQKATLNVENESYAADNYFRNQNISAILGLDYELFTNKNVFFTFGSQLTYGSDISQNGSATQLPLIFSHPHSLTIGIKLAVNFQLK
jgi:hypothetical protein